MLFPRTWVVVEVVIKVLLPIMIWCVLNQSHEHSLLRKALQFIIVACREKLANWVIPNSLVDPNANLFDEKLKEMMVKMKQKTLVVLFSFISFFICFHKKKGHNIFVMMFNPKFKTIHLVNSYEGHEKQWILIDEYDE